MSLKLWKILFSHLVERISIDSWATTQMKKTNLTTCEFRLFDVIATAQTVEAISWTMRNLFQDELARRLLKISFDFYFSIRFTGMKIKAVFEWGSGGDFSFFVCLIFLLDKIHDKFLNRKCFRNIIVGLYRMSYKRCRDTGASR